MYINIFACVIGLLLHGAMKWQEARVVQEKNPPGLMEYLGQVPAQTTVSVLATAGAFTVMYGVDWLNPGMSFACGYMGNSIAENLANRFSALK